MRNTAPQSTSESYEQLISRTSHAIQTGAYTQAIKWAEKATHKRPLHAQAYHLLAYALEKNGESDKALDKLLNNPAKQKNAAYHLYCGELLLHRAEYDLAIRYLQESIALQPEKNKARLGLIHAYRKLGNNSLAHLELNRLKQDRELTLHEKNIMLDSYTKINFHNHQLTVIAEIDSLLNEARLDARKLSGKLGELITGAYPDITDAKIIDLQHPLFCNEHFLSILKKMPMSNIHIEYALVHARRLLLILIAHNGEISDEQLMLCRALAYQNDLNEYVHYISDEELELLTGFIELLKVQASASDWQPADSEAIFIVLLMYQSLDSLSDTLNFPQDKSCWPQGLRDFVEMHLINRTQEIYLGEKTPSLTAISANTPADVRAQYEKNPYPRWKECSQQRMDSLGNYIKNIAPNIQLGNEYFNEKMRILVAGCGTGKQVIETAMLYPNTQITAFDISLRSLGYAQRKANALGISNIQFFHGDILELTETIGHFDLIECCGVLHHLVNPLAGWQKLTTLLADKGIMRIDLYSRLARADVIARKEQIALLNIGTSLNELRRFRWAVLAQNIDKSLIKFQDFYTTSECRDLLFHTQEVQYSLEEINQILDTLALGFVAMHVDENKMALFKQTFPQANITDWHYWSEFEKLYPLAFTGMYSFWCQK